MDKLAIRKRAEIYVSQEKTALFRDEIQTLLNDNKETELADRFLNPISFGTGGLRGLIGGGDAYINSLNIQKATQGIASYILQNADPSRHSVVISYDSRHWSKEFALLTALVLASNNIKSFLYAAPRPTPQLSYSIRELNATAGIMITASHNPSQYNGYKVYWDDGAQIVAPHDQGIIQEVRKANVDKEILDEKTAVEKGLLEYILDDLDKKYLDMVVAQSLSPQLFAENGAKAKVVFTPLHGIGYFPIDQVAQKLGVKLIAVEEQKEPNGDFPTVASPNPEEKASLQLAINLAQSHDADLILASDPDVDRLGVGVKVAKGEYHLLTGNQIGALFLDYICHVRQAQNRLTAQSFFFNTVVTSPLQGKIASSYGLQHVEVLTGFKYIGEQMRLLEKDANANFVFGCEESYGYLLENEVRDKDAVSAAMLAMELMLWNQQQGRTILEHLNIIYKKFGYYHEEQISRNFEGNKGKESIERILVNLRGAPQKQFAGKTVVEFRDYEQQIGINYADKTEYKCDHLPVSNVLYFAFDDDSSLLVRPSGTEPKVKFYLFASSSKTDLKQAKEEVSLKLKQCENDINTILDQA